MIRRNFFADTEPYEADMAYLESQREVVFEIMEEVKDEIEPHALNELRTQPPERSGKVRWKSEKQRRYVIGFVLERDEKGNIVPYQRTGDLAAGWFLSVIKLENGSALVIENPSNIAKFVYGSLAQNRLAALRFQQPFHQDTGWLAATDTVSFWVEAADELFLEKYDERLSDFGQAQTSQRAFTGRTR